MNVVHRVKRDSRLLDHYHYTGQRDLVSELCPNLRRLMEFSMAFKIGMACWSICRKDLMPAPMSELPGHNKLTGLNCYDYRALQDAAGAGVAGARLRPSLAMARKIPISEAGRQRPKCARAQHSSACAEAELVNTDGARSVFKRPFFSR